MKSHKSSVQNCAATSELYLLTQDRRHGAPPSVNRLPQFAVSPARTLLQARQRKAEGSLSPPPAPKRDHRRGSQQYQARELFHIYRRINAPGCNSLPSARLTAGKVSTLCCPLTKVKTRLSNKRPGQNRVPAPIAQETTVLSLARVRPAIDQPALLKALIGTQPRRFPSASTANSRKGILRQTAQTIPEARVPDGTRLHRKHLQGHPVPPFDILCSQPALSSRAVIRAGMTNVVRFPAAKENLAFRRQCADCLLHARRKPGVITLSLKQHRTQQMMPPNSQHIR